MRSVTAWFAAAMLAAALAFISAVSINCLTRDMTALEVFGMDWELDDF